MADEYIRKQDAIDDLHTQLMYRMGSDDMKRRLDDWVTTLPSADVASVVRCKDCENWQIDWNPSIQDRHYCAVMDSMMKAADFCSYGERREE